MAHRARCLLGDPLVASALLSAGEWNIITDPEWLGLQNYKEMLFEDRSFWISMR